MTDDRHHNRSDPDRSDPSAPDPSQDAWSAWLPELDRTVDKRTPAEEQKPEGHSKPSAAPRPPATTKSAPTQPSLPHVPQRPQPPVWAWRYQPAPPATAYHRPPNNHLLAAILVTIFCFWPFGVVAIIKAASVNTRWARGDWDGAYRAARAAKSWALAAFATALVFFAGSMVFGWMIWAAVS